LIPSISWMPITISALITTGPMAIIPAKMSIELWGVLPIYLE
jgi:hypothetical protein